MDDHYRGIFQGYTMWIPFGLENAISELILIRIDYHDDEEEAAIKDFLSAYSGEYAHKLNNWFNYMWVGAVVKNSIIHTELSLRFDFDYATQDNRENYVCSMETIRGRNS